MLRLHKPLKRHSGPARPYLNKTELCVVPCHGTLFYATPPCLQVPENLGDIERATTLLHGGHPLQQKSVIERCEHAAACTSSAQEG